MHRAIILFFVLTTACFGMEENRPQPILPLEVLSLFDTFKSTKHITYITNLTGPISEATEHCALPWTISPTYLKYCYANTPDDEDLTNPHPGDIILPNPQLWTAQGKYFRLSEDIRRTNDQYIPESDCAYDLLMYDGINKDGRAPFACKYKPNTSDATYELYMIDQSIQFGACIHHRNCKPSLKRNGTLCSLMLENESNNCLLSVDLKGIYSLIREKLISKKDFVFDHDKQIAVQTEGLFVKTVCLGKNFYYGITNTGKLYSIIITKDAITKKRALLCTEQKFSACPHTFKDISVDNCSSNKEGQKQKFTLLTDKGEIYITHLGAYVQPTLFYITTVENPDGVKRLFYKDSKLSIIYKDETQVFLWNDNFEWLYFNSLFKKMYNKSFTCEKQKSKKSKFKTIFFLRRPKRK